MLTPAFELTQNETFLKLVIEAKYAKIQDTEIFFEENDFKFYSKPYFLRLNLPGKVKSVDECDETRIIQYDTDSGKFTINIEKQNPGEVFEGLDLISRLLESRSKKTTTPIIEVVGGDGSSKADDDDDEDIDWHFEQVPYCSGSTTTLPSEKKYGFANQYAGVFARFQDEVIDLDVKDPETKSWTQRHKERVERECRDFNEDHYLADYFETEQIEPLLKYRSDWVELVELLDRDSSLCGDDIVQFTAAEKERMRTLPRKEHLLDKSETHAALLSLVDILYAYAYQKRTTEGENNVESGWTVVKLSATLSWLETPSSVKEAVLCGMRRSLCYPFFRNWNLAQAVLNDVKQLFRLGRKQLLKCLLEIHELFIDCDSRYILNDLYITDYCIWIQNVSTTKLNSISKKLQEVSVEKEDVDLDLEQLEIAGRLVQTEHEDTSAKQSATSSTNNPESSRFHQDDVCASLQQLRINDRKKAFKTDARVNAQGSLDACDVSGLEISFDQDDGSFSADSADYYLDSDDVSSEDEESKCKGGGKEEERKGGN